MLILNEPHNILTDSEKYFLEKKCEIFKATITPFKSEDSVNYFYREFLDNEIEEVQSIKNKVEKYAKEVLSDSKLIVDGGIWINKIDINSNKDDVFHTDNSFASYVIYLNDDFEGGDFEYRNELNECINVTPKKWTSVIMSKNVEHRVLPVTNGVRYSLVFFFSVISKTQKSII
jgi:hypothetical protein